MVVLPNILYAPNALRRRTTTGNGLGGGAIAGIVLGSLCGLLVYTPTIPANTPPKIDSTNTVDPWEVGYQPNPVIFSHLPAPVGDMQYQVEEKDALFTTSLTNPPRLDSMIEVCSASFDRFESPLSKCAPSTIPESEGTPSPLRRINTEFSETSVPISESSTLDLSGDDTSLVTVASEVPPHYKTKSPCLNGLGTVEIINFAAAISSDRSPGDSDTSMTVLSSPRSLTIANSNKTTLSSQTSSRTSPASNLSASKATILSSRSIEAETDPVYPCSICHLKFRTPGLRRTHQNREHNLRYPCGICNSRLGLRADLRRHENSVHRDDLHDASAKLFQCPNIGCSDPQKTYARKDNFTRHVNRCERAIAKAKSLHDAGMEKRKGNHRHWEMPGQTREHDPDVAM
ncbi:unnamed protein product [Alternaria burnsii]|nr:unnamed protein product [Alternaria burnsii]